MINKKKLLLIAFFMTVPSLYGMEGEGQQIEEVEHEREKALIKQLEKRIEDLSCLKTPLAQAEAHYNFVLKSLKSLHEEDENFDLNQKTLKDYLLSLGYKESDQDLKKVLQRNSAVDDQDKITPDARTKFFNSLDDEATEIRTGLVFADFARRLTTLLRSKQFAPVAVPSFHEISSDPNATFKWQEKTKKLIDFIIADWQSIKNKEINFKNSDNLNLLLGMENQQLGEIETLIYPLKNMALAEFSARIDSREKRAELLSLLEGVAGYLDWLKTEFQTREAAVNNYLYGKNENSKFTQDYNKEVSIKTMHDYLNTVLVSSKKYTKTIDFILQKFGRLTAQECIDGKNSYIEQVKPIREVGELLSVIGLLNMGLSLRGHTLNGMKQSGLELGVYLKNKELKSAAKYVGASFHKKHLFGLILPVAIGVTYYGHYKTDTLRQKRDRLKNVITELEKPYQRQPAEDLEERG